MTEHAYIADREAELAVDLSDDDEGAYRAQRRVGQHLARHCRPLMRQRLQPHRLLAPHLAEAAHAVRVRNKGRTRAPRKAHSAAPARSAPASEDGDDGGEPPRSGLRLDAEDRRLRPFIRALALTVLKDIEREDTELEV
jgi:hypothetical protein